MTLWILGALSIFLYHNSLLYQYNIPISEDFSHPISFFGAGLMFGGLYLLSLARIALNGFWGPDIYNYGSGDKLVTDGIYGKIRHPVYLGQILMTIGTFLLANNWLIAIMPSLLIVTNIIRAKREDNDLLERFGEEFKNYKETKPFMIPL